MTKRILLTLTFLIGFFALISSSYSQAPADSIQVEKGLVTKLYLKGKRVKINELLKITEKNRFALEEARLAKNSLDLTSTFAFIGGFMVCYPIGTVIGGREPEWAVAYIGSGLLVGSLPFYFSYQKHAEQAAHIYNGHGKQEIADALDIRFGLGFNGFGLRATF